MIQLTDKWLEEINGQFRKKDIPPGKRPWLAIQEWSTINNIAIYLDSEQAKKIFNWFEENTKSGSQKIGDFFTGIFYFDSSFWPVFIPLCYGKSKVVALDSLKTMPDKMKTHLSLDKNKYSEYIAVWIDCFDYAYGIDEIIKIVKGSSFAKGILRSADKELKSTVTLILANRPNPKSVETARFATEMFLKAFLAFENNLEDKTAKALNHDLVKILNICITISEKDFIVLKSVITRFPPIGDRYEGKDKTNREIWDSYMIAQLTAIIVVRLLSGRDSRSKLTGG